MEIFDHNYLISKFEDEIISVLFPDFKNHPFESEFHTIQARKDLPGNIEYQLSPNYLYSPDSEFYYDISKSLVHFTNRRVLFSILNDGFFRLYQLNSTNDLNEVKKISKLFDIENWRIDNFKNRLFFGSFCPENVLNSNDELLFWRLYGLNTDGVALKVKIKNLDKRDYQFGKVKYGVPDNISQFRIKYQNFLIENNLNTIDISETLNTFSSMHKSESFNYEKEVRLFFRARNNSDYEEGIGNDFGIDYKGKMIYYRKLPIKQSESKPNLPYLEIEEIILGPNSIDNLGQFRIEALKAKSKLRLGYNIEFRASAIDEHIQ